MKIRLYGTWASPRRHQAEPGHWLGTGDRETGWRAARGTVRTIGIKRLFPHSLRSPSEERAGRAWAGSPFRVRHDASLAALHLPTRLACLVTWGNRESADQT